MSRPSVPRRSVLRGAVGFGAAAGLGSLTACAPGATRSEPRKLTGTPSASVKGEVTIWNRSGDLFKVFDAAIDEFRKAHPNVKVNHQAVDIDAKLANTLITGADLPDGSFWDDAKIGGQAEHLYDLTDLIEPYRKDTSPTNSRSTPSTAESTASPGTWIPGCCGTGRTCWRTRASTRKASPPTTICWTRHGR